MNKARVIVISAILLLIITVEIVATNSIPEFRKLFYGALENKSVTDIKGAIEFFIYLMLALTLSQGLKKFTGATLALNIRTFLTKKTTKFWRKEKTLENTSQRINEDCKLATDLAVGIILEMVISGAIVIVLVIETWQDKSLLMAALIYTIVVSLVARLFKPKLISTEIALQRAEATHRHNISEALVFERRDRVAASVQDYREVAARFLIHLKVLLGYNLFSSSQNNFSILAPWLLLIPLYLAGSISLGEFMAKVSQFELIVINSTILISLYPNMTKAQASWIRIREFLKG